MKKLFLSIWLALFATMAVAEGYTPPPINSPALDAALASRTAAQLRAAGVAPAAALSVRQVGKRTQVPQVLTAASTQGMHRRAEIAGEALTTFRLIYGNFLAAANAETNPGATRLINGWVEYPAGTYTQVTFGGLAQATMADGQAQLVSDPITVPIPQGSTWWPVTRQESTAGVLSGLNLIVSSDLGDKGVVGTSVGTDPATVLASGATVGNGNFGPIAIVASSRVPAVCEVGDSIFEGTGDVQGGTIFSGAVGKALGPVFGVMNLSRGSMTVQSAVTNFAKRQTYLQYCTHGVTNLGTNDLGTGRSAAQALADRQSLYALAPALKWVSTTLTPRTTSALAWTDVSSQLLTNVEAQRVIFNNAVRATEPGTIGFFDVAAGVETGVNTGRWATGEQITVTDAAMTSGQASVTSNSTPFAFSMVGEGVVLTGAGASGANLVAPISYAPNSDGKTAYLNTNAGTTVSGATMKIGSLTADGLHPNTIGYNRMRPYVDLGIIRGLPGN